MELYLVRHAIAEERDPRRWPDDAQRPLSERGRARFARAAAGLRTLGVEVDLLLSSPYARAWATAEILSEEAGWPAPVVVDDSDNTLLAAYGFSGFPAFIAIDANGIVVERAGGNIGGEGVAALFDEGDEGLLGEPGQTVCFFSVEDPGAALSGIACETIP